LRLVGYRSEKVINVASPSFQHLQRVKITEEVNLLSGLYLHAKQKLDMFLAR
jgi:hypothetical protein